MQADDVELSVIKKMYPNADSRLPQGRWISGHTRMALALRLAVDVTTNDEFALGNAEDSGYQEDCSSKRLAPFQYP